MSQEPIIPLQNDPDRAAGSLVTDAQGEFVAARPGGAFDPRAFRGTPSRPDARTEPPRTPAEDESEPARPPVDDQRMSGPGEEIDKAG